MRWQTKVINVGVHTWESGYLARILCRSCDWVHAVTRNVYIGYDVTWLALCLDGADVRRLYHPRSSTDYPEHVFLDVVETYITKLGRDPVIQLEPAFQDGMILAYEYASSARTLCYDIARELQSLNQHISNWEWRYHLRASSGRQINTMLSGLPHAKRDKLWSCENNPRDGTEISLV